uniref:HYR domain-containing protein n=1 Tax=Magallana gigas TaxID=29159 RepID=A0A8W8JGJ0_MAGGI
MHHHPPKLSHCPTDTYSVVGERISWTVPKATDNVGIRDLWLEPRVSDGSRIGPGEHMFRYVAEDCHSNKAECRFLVSVKISESGWPTELKSRTQTDTSVIIGTVLNTINVPF